MHKKKHAAYSFPSSLKVKDLEVRHPEYNAEKITKHAVLYEAGTKFRDHIDKFLVKRQIEKSGTVAGVDGNAHYENRKEKAWYIPRGAGLIDWIVAAIFKNEPRIVCPGDKTGYWEGLNKDVDGNGTDLCALARRATREVLLQGRSSFGLNFKTPTAHAAEPETMNAQLVALPAAFVDNWQYDETGRLLWVRTYREYALPATPWQPAVEKTRCWTFWTAQETATYIYKRPLGQKEAPEDAQASGVIAGHDFGAMPVFPIRAGHEMFVMERIFEILVALFNREVSITWALDNLAYAMLVLNLSDTDLSKIVASELAALRLGIGEQAGYIAPPPGVVEPLFKDAERLKRALYEVIQALAINAAATQTQNARQSADAKEIDRDPLHILLSSFASPVRDALERMIADLKRYRGEEDLEVDLVGMDEFDATLADAEAAIKPDGKKSGKGADTEPGKESKSE